MSTVIDSIERAQLRKGLPSFDPGDRVRVHFQVIEGTRSGPRSSRASSCERQGSGARETFTVRKQSFGVGVERTFPAALAEDRETRDRRARRRAPGQALLPARPDRQGGAGRRAALGHRRGAWSRRRSRRSRGAGGPRRRGRDPGRRPRPRRARPRRAEESAEDAPKAEDAPAAEESAEEAPKLSRTRRSRRPRRPPRRASRQTRSPRATTVRMRPKLMRGRPRTTQTRRMPKTRSRPIARRLRRGSA